MTINKDGKGVWKYDPETGKPLTSAPEQNNLPYFGSTFTLDKPPSEVLKELGYEDPEKLRDLRKAEDRHTKPRRVLIEDVTKGYIKHREGSMGPEEIKQALYDIGARYKVKSLIIKCPCDCSCHDYKMAHVRGCCENSGKLWRNGEYESSNI